MKVLVVDDDVVARMMLMHQIDNCGQFEIVEAEDGEHAWRMLADGLRPGIMFCDLRMPNLDGMGLLARVRADPVLAALPVVLVSAASDGDTLSEAGRLGADGYIVKPFAAGQVRAQLARLVQPDADPAEVAQRLGVSLDRLLLYLGGLQRQLEEAGPAIASLPSLARSAQLERLAEGCATLGLADGAARLRSAGVQDDAQLAQTALAQALGGVLRQQARAQAQP
ncbi:response regulator [Massilia sp. IC2-477]|uniref:response regulator n=1 Tax=Massilia sp. IC2-477 TaxID=2887198 RepID=UPI001D12C1CF|nr:response regulator [Massilia sp. IC2-477]MCC2954606.1 response regulator [Massilia sp. IC2-477]